MIKLLLSFVHYGLFITTSFLIILEMSSLLIRLRVTRRALNRVQEQQVYSFVESELLDVLPTLSTDVRANYGRMSKYVGAYDIGKTVSECWSVYGHHPMGEGTRSVRQYYFIQ